MSVCNYYVIIMFSAGETFEMISTVIINNVAVYLSNSILRIGLKTRYQTATKNMPD
jgi:hypothetical protein